MKTFILMSSLVINLFCAVGRAEDEKLQLSEDSVVDVYSYESMEPQRGSYRFAGVCVCKDENGKLCRAFFADRSDGMQESCLAFRCPNGGTPDYTGNDSGWGRDLMVCEGGWGK